VGYLAAGVRALLTRGRLAWLLLLPFVTLPVVFETVQPLRMTMYSVVALLALGKVVLTGLRPGLVGNPYRELVGLAALVTLLAFWRTEGLFYLVLLPVMAVRLGVVRDLRRGAAAAALAVAMSTALVVGGAALTTQTTQPEYTITALYNPLSVMVAEGVRGGDVAHDLALLDTVVDVSVMRQHGDYSDVPGFWVPGAVRPGYAAHMRDFYRGAVDLIEHNPVEFAVARWKTFWATNGLDPAYARAQPGDLFLDRTTSPRIAQFERDNAAAAPLDQDLRLEVLRDLQALDASGRQTGLRPFTWTLLPTLAGLVLLVVAQLARRRWSAALVPALLLVHTGAVLVTAPADYFMYYLPVFVVGNWLLTVHAVRLVDRLLRRHGRPVRRPVAAVPPPRRDEDLVAAA
jgi:hypothetical protein